MSSDQDWLKGLEKTALPSNWDKPIPSIWTTAEVEGNVMLARPEDPFSDLANRVDAHNEQKQDIYCQLVDRAEAVADLQDSLFCATRQASFTDSNEILDDLRERVNLVMENEDQLKDEVENLTEDTVDLIDAFEQKHAKKEPKKTEKSHCWDNRVLEPKKGLEVITPNGPGVIEDIWDEDRSCMVRLHNGFALRPYRTNRLSKLSAKTPTSGDAQKLLSQLGSLGSSLPDDAAFSVSLTADGNVLIDHATIDAYQGSSLELKPLDAGQFEVVDASHSKYGICDLSGRGPYTFEVGQTVTPQELQEQLEFVVESWQEEDQAADESISKEITSVSELLQKLLTVQSEIRFGGSDADPMLRAIIQFIGGSGADQLPDEFEDLISQKPNPGDWDVKFLSKLIGTLEKVAAGPRPDLRRQDRFEPSEADDFELPQSSSNAPSNLEAWFDNNTNANSVNIKSEKGIYEVGRPDETGKAVVIPTKQILERGDPTPVDIREFERGLGSWQVAAVKGKLARLKLAKLQGLITEDQLAEAESEFPGITKFFHEKDPDAPTFLNLVHDFLMQEGTTAMKRNNSLGLFTFAAEDEEPETAESDEGEQADADQPTVGDKLDLINEGLDALTIHLEDQMEEPVTEDAELDDLLEGTFDGDEASASELAEVEAAKAGWKGVITSSVRKMGNDLWPGWEPEPLKGNSDAIQLMTQLESNFQSTGKVDPSILEQLGKEFQEMDETIMFAAWNFMGQHENLEDWTQETIDELWGIVSRNPDGDEGGNVAMASTSR